MRAAFGATPRQNGGMPADDGIERGGHDVRRAVSGSNDIPYRSFDSLGEAQAADDGAVVLSGDYGGTIFLTCPARQVACDETALSALVSDLDAVTWMSGDPTIATVAFEARPIGSGVLGGDGGGIVIDGVWTHPNRLPSEVAAQAVEVVKGQRRRIDGSLLSEARREELERKRAWRESHPPASERLRNLPWDADRVSHSSRLSRSHRPQSAGVVRPWLEAICPVLTPP